MASFFSAILYYLVLKPISFLPKSLLFLLSDFVALILSKVVGYRKAVIHENINKSFPDKSKEEKETIAQQFYQHFTDVFIESLKGISENKAQAKQEVVYENIELLDELYAEQKDVILVLGHIGNWEKICIHLPLFVQFKVLGVYKPLKNKFFDAKVKAVRSRYGLELVAMQDVNKKIKEITAQPKAVLMIGDQSPSNPKRAYWTNFLNQETAVLTGTEKFAKIYDMPVVYMHIAKPKRGAYNVRFELLSADSKSLEKTAITTMHTNALEGNIKRFPHLWLWSHKRWKHKKE